MSPFREETTSPWDDELWDFRPATGAGDTLCRQLEDAAFISEVSGCSPEEARKVVEPVPLAPAATKSSNDLGNLLKRAIFVTRSAALRKSAIKGIVDAAKNSDVFRPIKGDDRWTSLSQSIDEFVTVAILTAG